MERSWAGAAWCKRISPKAVEEALQTMGWPSMRPQPKLNLGQAI